MSVARSIFGTVLVLLVAVWALAAIASRPGPITPPSEQQTAVAPSTSSSEPPPSLSSPSAPDAAAWELVADDALAAYTIRSPIVTSEGIVAVATGQDLRIARSPDGRIWALDPPDVGLLAAPADHGSQIEAIAVADGRFVGVGAHPLFDSSTGLVEAWTSDDGRRWTPSLPIEGDPNALMEAAVRGPDEWVAVGSRGFPGANTQLPGASRAAVWTSTDGSAWRPVADQASLHGSIMTGVAVTPDGYVAWGQRIPVSLDRNQGPPVWTSPDARTWTRLASFPDPPSFTRVSRILVLTDRWVTVGSIEDPNANRGAGGQRARAWTSRDRGATWEPVDLGAGPPPADSAFARDLAIVGSDLVAVGSEELGPAGEQTRAIAWRSADLGESWTAMPSGPAFTPATADLLIGYAGRAVVFGAVNDLNALEARSRIWLSSEIR